MKYEAEHISTTTAWMHKCSTCKGTRRVDWTHEYEQGSRSSYDHKWTAEAVKVFHFWGAEFGRTKAPVIACTCGGTMGGRMIEASISDHKCDARCMNSRGHVCECSCGGANHGKAFMLTLEMA